MHPATSHGLAASIQQAEAGGSSGGSGSAGGGSATTAATNSFVVPPDALDPAAGQPTAKEQAREMFRGTFIGTYTIGSPRFTNQTSLINIQAAGTSTVFLHGDIQVGIATYPDSQPAYGEATSFDRNINSNSALGIDLVGTGAVDREGRPTQFTFTIDQNVSSGTFVEATAGPNTTVTIKYLSNGRSGKGVLDQGKAIVVVKGDIYTLGTSNILGVFGTNNGPRQQEVPGLTLGSGPETPRRRLVPVHGPTGMG